MYKNKRNFFVSILLVSAICCFTGTQSFGQSTKSQRYLDSIYNKYVSVRNPQSTQPGRNAVEKINYSDHKCGFSLTGQIHSNLKSFSSQQQQTILQIDNRPTLETSMLSPSGHFRVHYDNIGRNKPQYDPSLSVAENVRQVTLALDSAWSFEINHLEFPAPPTDSLRGGDNAYDVYLVDMGDYGNTSFETDLGGDRWGSYIEMDNDFSGGNYYTHGFAAARATAAHEFHHAIQIGAYIFRDEDTFFHEITSTAMEEFVFSASNDYYGYMPDYFNTPEKTFSSHRGYDLAIWNIFLKDRYGVEIIKRQWELYVQNRAIAAINISILEASGNQSSFKSELSEFGIWSFYTDHRAISGKYFEEARFYKPGIRPQVTEDFNSAIFPIRISSQPLSNYYVSIHVVNQNRIDTIITKLTDGDLTRALNNPSLALQVDYSVFTDSIEGSRKIVNNYFSKLTSSKDVFQQSDFYNNVLVHGNEVDFSEIDYAYPNPFKYKNILNNNKVCLPVEYNELKNADIYIYSIGMDLVYSGNSNIFADPQTNKFVVTWDGKDSKGSKLSTGVYIYVVHSNGNIKKGKIVIQNE